MEETYSITVKALYYELIEQFVITYGVVPDSILDDLWDLARLYSDLH